MTNASNQNHSRLWVHAVRVMSVGALLASASVAANAMLPQAAPDLKMSKTLITNGANGVVTFNVVVSNIGTATAMAPNKWVDALQPGFPAGTAITNVSGHGSAVCSQLPTATLTCTASTSGSHIPGGSGWSGIVVTVKVPPAGGTFTNCADVTKGPSGPPEPTLVNNKECVTVTVPSYGCFGTGYVSQGTPLLCWMPVGTAKKTYAPAAAACAGTINGSTGWRLPTKAELLALYASGAMNGAGWPGITWNWILSSTSAPGGKHWTVNLNSNHAQAGQSADLVDATQFAYSCVKP